MGRGRRGKTFRRTVAGIPIARFRGRLAAMAATAGLRVIAVDPAYTSRWGNQHWRRPLQQTSGATVTRHHAAAVGIRKACPRAPDQAQAHTTPPTPEDDAGPARGPAHPPSPEIGRAHV